LQWNIDPSHTSVEFAVRHLAISTVRGRFKKVTGTLETTTDGQLTAVQAAVDAASIDTADAQRDTHLRSGDFLEAERYPVLAFQSTRVAPRGEGRYLVTGNLTIRDQTRAVSLEVETSKPITDPWGNLKAGATASGTLNRKDWGVTWNQVLELGALLVGEEVRFTIDVEAAAEKAQKAAAA